MPYPHHLHTANRDPRYTDGLPASLPPLPPQKQLVEVILLRSELLHDIEAQIHQLQKARAATVPAASAAGSQSDILPTGGADNYLLSRYIDTAVNQAVSRCSAYLLLPSPYAHRVSTDHAHQWEEKSIILALPHNWPPHCLEPLRDAVHNFIVFRALQLFFAFSDERAALAADNLALNHYDDINVQLNARLGPTNVHPTFLG